MKELFKMVAVLTLICTCAGALLALVNDATAGPIARAKEEAKAAAVMQVVLPDIDNNPVSDAMDIDVDGVTWTFFVGRKRGRMAGVAFMSRSPNGYGGTIEVLVGVNAEQGTVQGIQILSHQETPGLGAKISDTAFRDQFVGVPWRNAVWKVAKDGGPIDEVTAATISSRAVCEAVETGLAVFAAHREQLAGGTP